MDANTSLQIVSKLATDLLAEVRVRITDLRTLTARMVTTRDQVDAAANQTKTDRAAVTALLAGLAVPHRWVGTRLDLMGPDGVYIEGQDLKGSKGLNPRGAYNPTATYQPDDIANVGNRIWRALQPVSGVTPVEGPKWRLFLDAQAAVDAAEQATAAVTSTTAAVLTVQTAATAVLADKTAVAADRQAVANDRAATQTAKAAVDASAAAAAGSATSASNTDLSIQAVKTSIDATALQIAGQKSAVDNAAQSTVAVSGLSNLAATFRAALLDPNTIATFAYDTRYDTDGGAWRFMVSTSIMNEPLNTATRGSTVRYPSLMLIAVTTMALTIYDGDDPATPMWAVFQAAGITTTGNIIQGGSLVTSATFAACNGLIAMCDGNVGLRTFDLIGDTSDRITSAATANTGRYMGNLAERNAGKGRDLTSGALLDGPKITLVHHLCNHVLARVLPHTPPNPSRCGLPNPLVGIATDLGASIIRPDGVVVNSLNSSAVKKIAIGDDLTLYLKTAGGDTTLLVHPYPSYLVSAFPNQVINGATVPPSMYNVGSIGGITALAALAGGRVAYGANVPGGFNTLLRDKGNINRSWVNYINQWINTGWMPTNTKMALAESSKLLTSLTGVTKFSDDFSDNDVSDWTATGGATLSGVGSELTVTVGSTAGYNYAGMTISGLTIGQIYTVECKFKRNGGHSARLGINDTTIVGMVIASAATASTTYVTGKVQFFALSTSVKLQAMVDSPTPTIGAQAMFKDIVVKEVAGDRSATNVAVAGNCADIVGTVDRVQVAVGAELAGVANLFTNNSHMKVKNVNGALNLGTGDFFLYTWTVSPEQNTCMFHFTDEAGTGGGNGASILLIFYTGTAAVSGFVSDGTNFSNITFDTMPTAGAHMIGLGRRGSKFVLVVDGKEVASVTNAAIGSLSNSAANLLIGARYNNGTLAFRPNRVMSLQTLCAYMPTAPELLTLFRDEWEMHQPGTKITTQGGYIVQDLFEDRDTGLLYAAKSAGGTDVWLRFVNKATILSTASSNLLPCAGTLVTWLNTSDAVAGNRIVNANSWGSGAMLPLVDNTTNIAHYLRTIVTFVAGSHTMVIPFKAAAKGIAFIMIPTANIRLWIDLATGATSSPVGCTALPSINFGNGVWGIHLTFTHPGGSDQVYAGAAGSLGSTVYAGAGNVAVYVGDGMLRTGSTAIAAGDFAPSVSRSDNHKSVTAADGHVIIGTGNGADIVMPALPLRGGVRFRRPIVAYDPDYSGFNGRVTPDATPVFSGNPFFVPEGGKINYVISIDAATPGGTATERAAYTIFGYAYRNIGDPSVTIVQRSNVTPAPSETTLSMDATMWSPGGGWVGISVTGKAASPLEWFGDQTLVRAAA